MVVDRTIETLHHLDSEEGVACLMAEDGDQTEEVVVVVDHPEGEALIHLQA